MGLDLTQFRENIVRPAITAINLWSESAEDLLIGTAILESDIQYVYQLPSGPACGIMQMEQPTYSDTLNRVSVLHPEIINKALAYLYMTYFPQDCQWLTGNLFASVIFARLKYYLDPAPLPISSDSDALAAYYKRVYNTAGGKADLADAQKVFRSLCAGVNALPQYYSARNTMLKNELIKN